MSALNKVICCSASQFHPLLLWWWCECGEGIDISSKAIIKHLSFSQLLLQQTYCFLFSLLRILKCSCTFMTNFRQNLFLNEMYNEVDRHWRLYCGSDETCYWVEQYKEYQTWEQHFVFDVMTVIFHLHGDQQWYTHKEHGFTSECVKYYTVVWHSFSHKERRASVCKGFGFYIRRVVKQ
jgi:hypothetical protein